MKIKTYFLETRPHFLVLSVVLIFLSTSMAWHSGYFNPGYTVLSLIGLILLHTSTNVLNDYYDYKSGIDLNTERTPFSGGSGILPTGGLDPRSVYLFAVGCLLIGGTIGAYFVYVLGWNLLPLILVGAFTIYFYTTHLSHWYLGEFFTGLNFGFLMTVGAFFLMAGRYSVSAFVPAIIPGVLGFTLLFINEFPDVEPDMKVGRRNIVMALGLERSSKLYAALVASPYVWVLICLFTRLMPFTISVTFLTLPIHVVGQASDRERKATLRSWSLHWLRTSCGSWL